VPQKSAESAKLPAAGDTAAEAAASTLSVAEEKEKKE
jgi:hypothetical protein